ncbi:MAG TPA: hypothetical protein VIV11_27570 [Kofleriaceae bacterium]
MLALKNALVYVVVFGALVVLSSVWGAGERVNMWMLINASALPFVCLLVVVCTLLVHVAVARAVKLDVHEVRLGAGPNLALWRAGEVEIWLNAHPFVGVAALSARSSRLVRARAAIALLTGPLVILALLVALLQVVPEPFAIRTAGGFAFAELTLWAALLVVFTSVLPVPGSIAWQLKNIALHGEEARADFLAARFLYPSERARRARDYDRALEYIEAGLRELPNQLALENSLALLHLDRGDNEAARAAFIKLLERSDVQPILRGLLQNNIAWVDLMIGNPDSLAEADRYSEQALKAWPLMPVFKGTRGAVLIELGRVEDGIKLVKESLGFHAEAAPRASMHCWLAIANDRLGRIDEAKKHLETARAIDPRCKLIERADQAIRT